MPCFSQAAKNEVRRPGLYVPLGSNYAGVYIICHQLGCAAATNAKARFSKSLKELLALIYLHLS